MRPAQAEKTQPTANNQQPAANQEERVKMTKVTSNNRKTFERITKYRCNFNNFQRS